MLCEAGVKGNGRSEARFPVLQEPRISTSPIITHLGTENRQCLADRKKTLQGETRVCSRQRPLAWKPLEPEG